MAKVEEENKSGNLWDLPAYIPEGTPGMHKSTRLRYRMKRNVEITGGSTHMVAPRRS
jgi:hypothetical protein